MQTVTPPSDARPLWDAVRKPKAAVIITLTIALMINLALGVYMTIPSYLASVKSEQQLAERKQQLADLVNLPGARQASEEEVAMLKAKLPVQIDGAELLQQYYGYSLQTGTVLTAISTLDAGRDTGGEDSALLASASYQMSAIGSMSRLMQLYESISTSDNLTDVTDWNMIPASGADVQKYGSKLPDVEELYSLQLTVKVYTMTSTIAENLGG